jgi:hypothetical protein
MFRNISASEIFSVSTKNCSVLVLPNHQHTLKMGMELVPETSGHLHISTRLSARENIVPFCHRESFQTYVCSSAQQTKFCPLFHNTELRLISTGYGMSAGETQRVINLRNRTSYI